MRSESRGRRRHHRTLLDCLQQSGRRLLIMVLAMLTLLVWTSAHAMKRTDPVDTYRVASDGWNFRAGGGPIDSIENLRQALRYVEVIVHAKELEIVLRTNTELATRKEALPKQRVYFIACKTGMKRRDVGNVDLLPFAGRTGPGSVRALRRQRQGWRYIRVGQ